MAFDDDIALRAAGDGATTARSRDGWATPRGPHGGYVMALVLRAMELRGRRPRAPAAVADGALPAPAARSARSPSQPTVERAGRSLTTVTARLEQDGKPIALGARRLLDAPGRARRRTTRRCRTSRHPTEPSRAAAGRAAVRATSSRCSRASATPPFSRLRARRGGRLDRPARGAPARRPRAVRARRRLVPRDLAAAHAAPPGADDRPDRPLPRAAPASTARCSRASRTQLAPRRLLRGGRRAVGDGRDARRPVPSARAAAAADQSSGEVGRRGPHALGAALRLLPVLLAPERREVEEA